jgi:Uma2 family endonuclease
MAELARKKATHEDLYGIPENAIGEIIDGELIVSPRPARPHIHAASTLGMDVGPPYQFGRGGPGGWVIYDEPELQLGEHTMVPDLAGWKRERIQSLPAASRITVPPDWVCEVLSPSTVRVDKVRKMPIYAQYGVSHIWLVDPTAKSLDVFRLDLGRWLLLQTFVENDKVRAEPFHEIEIDLGNLWIAT